MTGAYAGGVPVAEVVRSGFVEGRHLGSVAVLDASGELVAAAGDPRGPIFPRSSNKLMQAVAMLRSGFEPPQTRDLALAAASHSGEPFHVERVLELLEIGGLDEADLLCPPDLPLSTVARDAVLRSGGAAARAYMNCSGKHTGMLLTCVANGWSTEDYVTPDHPLQKACRTALEDLAAEPVPAIGVDGCGAPVMALSLMGLARAYLTAVDGAPGTPHRRVADAMRAFPAYVSGSDREDLRLMRAVPTLLSKGGAEGVWVAAVPGVGAVAIKIDDGAARARTPVMVAALHHLNTESLAVEGLDDLAEEAVLGGGRAVGCVRALPW
jgi:L-asparaginase II